MPSNIVLLYYFVATVVNKMTSSVESSFTTATEMFKEVFEQVAKERQELDKEKKEWEEEKTGMGKKFIFNGPRIVLDVGGTHYSTSRSTLIKHPESMLGVMFSGRHDLETMQCKDGSFSLIETGLTLDTSSIICVMEKKQLSPYQIHLMFYWSFSVKLNFTNLMVSPHCSNRYYVKMLLLNRIKLHSCFLLVVALIIQIMEEVPLMLTTIQEIRLILNTKI